MNSCEPCIMIEYKCMIKVLAEELIDTCPCFKCIVKVTCTYDDTCKPYKEHFDKLYYDPKYKELVEQYETRHNSYR